MLAVLLGVLIGAVMGLTGAGGGILALPALVLGMGFSMTLAVPVALLAVAVAAFIGTFDGLRRGLTRYRAAALMALAGMLTAPLGVALAHRLSEVVLLLLFSLIMLLVAWRMFSQDSASGGSTLSEPLRRNCLLNPQSGRLRWTWPCSLTLAGIGTLSGFLTGLLGVGGGFLIVPAFQRFSNINLQGVVSTSLMVILLVSLSTVAGAFAHGITIPAAGWAFVAAVAVGMLLGRWLVPKVPALLLQRGFAIIALAVALLMLVQSANS